jgi:4'-phosphopantetheinyl transferase
LPPGEVHVWLADLDLQDAAVEKLSSLLDPQEKHRAARFLVLPARKQFVISRGFLRTVLGKYLDVDPRAIQFRLTSHGKPELAEDRGAYFNLSHTEGLAAIGITRVSSIGVDVESTRRKVEALQLADRFFSRKEAEWVRAQAEPMRASCFLACWTAKEAYVKAHGGGLSVPLDGFAIIPDPEQLQLKLEVFGKPAESERWSMWRLELPEEFRGALAVEGQVGRVRTGRFEF